jgi:RNA methyltransferase, TrmH family
VSRVTVVTSKANPLLARLRKLAADGAAYRREGQVWIEGEHLCDAFLRRGGMALQAVVTEEAWATPALRALAARADAVAVVPSPLMAGVSTLPSPPPIAFVVPWAGAVDVQPGAATVVLDRVQDAGNVGSILRSAAAFGVAQVVALTGTAALWAPKVLRAGMGAHFALNLVEGAGDAALAALAVPLLGTSPRATGRIDQVDLPWPCAWVLGHEGQGIAPALAARCERLLAIVQPGGEESLNVAAAAAVCLHESARRRQG